MTSSLVIAVDGTSGSGKSSTSRGVAERLGLRYLDTGAMFRAMTWWLLSEGVDVHDVEGARAADVLSVSVLTGGCTRAELEEAGTDVVLDDLSAFPAWLDAAVRDRSA